MSIAVLGSLVGYSYEELGGMGRHPENVVGRAALEAIAVTDACLPEME